jgi:hypothetical protein
MVSGSGGFIQPIGEYFSLLWWRLLSFIRCFIVVLSLFPPQHGVLPLSDWAGHPPFCHYRRNTVPTPSLSVAIVTTEPNQWRQSYGTVFSTSLFCYSKPSNKSLYWRFKRENTFSKLYSGKRNSKIMKFKKLRYTKCTNKFLV